MLIYCYNLANAKSKESKQKYRYDHDYHWLGYADRELGAVAFRDDGARYIERVARDVGILYVSSGYIRDI